MIIIGYQGIGKSTISRKNLKKVIITGFDNKPRERYLNFIDLESSNFFVDGVRANDWYIPYGQIALDLSRQGNVVFTSSHLPVREFFIKNKTEDDEIFCCFPSVDLKDLWIERLEDRYNESKLDKDYRALMNAKDRYLNNISELAEDGLKLSGNIEIKQIPYDLDDTIVAHLLSMPNGNENIALNFKRQVFERDVVLSEK